MNSTVHYMVMATTKSNGARYPQWGKFFDATPLLGGAGGGFDSGGLAMDGGGTMAVAGGEVVVGASAGGCDMAIGGSGKTFGGE